MLGDYFTALRSTNEIQLWVAACHPSRYGTSLTDLGNGSQAVKAQRGPWLTLNVRGEASSSTFRHVRHFVAEVIAVDRESNTNLCIRI